MKRMTGYRPSTMLLPPSSCCPKALQDRDDSELLDMPSQAPFTSFFYGPRQNQPLHTPWLSPQIPCHQITTPTSNLGFQHTTWLKRSALCSLFFSSHPLKCFYKQHVTLLGLNNFNFLPLELYSVSRQGNQTVGCLRCSEVMKSTRYCEWRSQSAPGNGRPKKFRLTGNSAAFNAVSDSERGLDCFQNAYFCFPERQHTETGTCSLPSAPLHPWIPGE